MTLGLALVAVAAAGLAAGVVRASGEVTDAVSGLSVSADVSPKEWVFRDGRPHVSYRLHLTTGAEPVRLRVAVRAPVARERGQSEPFGDALKELERRPILIGPGQITSVVQGPVPSIPASFPGFCYLGYSDNVFREATISLPAQSHSDLVFRYRVLLAYTDIDFGLHFRLQGGTLGRTLELSAPRPRLRETAIRVHLRIGRGSSAFHRVIRPGDSILIAGDVRPRLAHQPVMLHSLLADDPHRVFPRPGTQPHTFAHLLTDRRGRFSYRWSPSRLGNYAAWAVVRPRSRRRLVSYSCARGLVVG